MAIPDDELDLPVLLLGNGEGISLRMVPKAIGALGGAKSANEVVMKTMNKLGVIQQADLAIARISARPEFEFGVLGKGALNRDEAIAAIRKGSAVGRKLIALELGLAKRYLAQAIAADDEESGQASIVEGEAPSD